MKLFLAVFCLAALSLSANADRYLLLPDTLPQLSRDLSLNELLFNDEEVSLVKISDEKVSEWSEKVHQELHACGGFIDVTDEISAGQSPENLVWSFILNKRKPEQKIGAPAVVFKDRVGALVAKASEGQMWAFLKELSSFPDRSATTENGGKAAKFLRDRAELLGKGVGKFRTWTVATGKGMYQKQPSVGITLDGSDKSLPHVVIGAHMDTFSPEKPGADDDGSGVAVVMEALRVTLENRASFKHTIDFIFYSAEERGLVGSNYVVKKFKADKIEVSAALQLDMVGLQDIDQDNGIYLLTDYTNESLNKVTRSLIETYTKVKVGESRCGYGCSDHVNWHLAGVPTTFPFETSFENYNPRIHSSEDKMEFISSAHALPFAQLALAYLAELAELQ